MNQSSEKHSYVSIFDLIRVGIGPSSSHTVGPMRAAKAFVKSLQDARVIRKTATLRADFYGSLALTGRGHATDRATLLGFEGGEPHTIASGAMAETYERIRHTKTLRILDAHPVTFDPSTDLVFRRRESLPRHPNGMRFSSIDERGATLAIFECYSVGGGMIIDTNGCEIAAPRRIARPVPYPFGSADELLECCDRSKRSIPSLMMSNECVFHHETEVRRKILSLWTEMKACATRGCRSEGTLPGALRVPRRACELYRSLSKSPPRETSSLQVVDWVNVWAIAIGEENAAGNRIVTAPTNGAAALLPAVLHYYEKFCKGHEAGIIRFFLTAAAIGSLFQRNASISGAEVGCQGEIGVASSMAAAGLAAALGADSRRIEKAAEIAMEHYLGLTCDPVAGLVQVPCIERNAFGALQAINAQRLALCGPEEHIVSLDTVIATMRQTGIDMNADYRETAVGGLAANVNPC